MSKWFKSTFTAATSLYGSALTDPVPTGPAADREPSSLGAGASAMERQASGSLINGWW